MTKEQYIELINLTTRDDKQLLINEQFTCRFIIPEEFKDDDIRIFTEPIQEENCPRISQYVDVKIYDCNTFKSSLGRLYLYHDLDLNSYSMSLCIKSENDNSYISMHSVLKHVVQDATISVIEFMKNIKYKPLYKVAEPYDKYGLTICQFKEYNNFLPNLEFTEAGQIYFEIINNKNYNDGDLIPLQSDIREVVIQYVRLTKDNMISLANKINECLESLYNLNNENKEQ